VTIAPRDPIEQTLVEVLRDVLGRAQVGLRDDFFELGGHSVLALRMMIEIQRRLGIELPLTALLEAPTIERLAEALRAAGAARTDAPLVAIQATGDHPPLFCIGEGEDRASLRELSRHLGPAQPLYALGVDGGPGPGTIVETASANLAHVREIQARGPYLLGGFGKGAMVAFEMAQQLRADGQEVALLALCWERARPPLAESVRSWLKEATHRLRRDGTPIYVPRTYPGRMTVFLAGGKSAAPSTAPLSVLAGLSASAIEVVEVPGSRGSMLREPHVRVLARQLDDVLRRTRDPRAPDETVPTPR